MKITMEIKDLIGELLKAFPEMDETKLKAAMLDLVLGNEMNVQRHAAVPVYSQSLQQDEPAKMDEPTNVPFGMGMTGMTGLPAPVASSWADVGRTSTPTVTESAFDDEDVPQIIEQPTARKAAPGKKDRAARDEARKARRKDTDQFAGMDDKQIAEFLTNQQESKQKKKNGQYVDIGSDSGSDDMAIG